MLQKVGCGGAYAATLIRRAATCACCAGRLLKRRALIAADGGATDWVAEAVGELAAGLVDFFAALEDAAAILPVVC